MTPFFIGALDLASEQEIRDYYNAYHSNRGSNAWRPFEAYSIFLDHLQINKDPGLKLLDIGCGTGFLLKEASRRGLKTHGIDISDEGVKIAKKISPVSEITVGSGERLKFPDESFDYITCLGALEHFGNIDNAVAEMKRVGKKSAKYLIVVPNTNYLLWKIKGEKGTEQRNIREALFSLEEWRKIFLKQGFRIENILKDDWPGKIKIITSFNPILILRNIAYKTFWVFHPLKVTYQFVFILNKA